MKKHFLRTVATTSLITLTFGLSVFAAPQKMSDGNTFDPEFYANTYPDVKAALGTDTNTLYQHYLKFGKAEGRLPYDSSAKTSTSAPTANTADAAKYIKSTNDACMYAIMNSVSMFDVETYATELNTALTGNKLKFSRCEKRWFYDDFEDELSGWSEESRTPLKNGKTKKVTQYGDDPIKDTWIVGPIDSWDGYNISRNADGSVNTLTPVSEPDAYDTWHFAYDALGRVTDAVSTRENSTTSFACHMTYDDNNHMVSMSYRTYREYTFTYDATGNLVSATGSNPPAFWNCTYDANGNLVFIDQRFYQSSGHSSGYHFTTRQTFY